MSFPAKVIIAADVFHHTKDIVPLLRSMSFIQNSEIQLVHIFHTMTYVVDVNEYPLAFPVVDDRKQIEKFVLNSLNRLKEDIFPKTSKVATLSLFSDDPKRYFCDYIERERPDLVILAARKKRGVFEGSFSQFITKHTESNILILKLCS